MATYTRGAQSTQTGNAVTRRVLFRLFYFTRGIVATAIQKATSGFFNTGFN